MIPGEFSLRTGVIKINEGLPASSLRVVNTGDRPVQVGSHFHFAETNTALVFDREAARGVRLDIPAGTAVRFEPGDAKDVDLVAMGGHRVVRGFHGDVDGPLDPTTIPDTDSGAVSTGKAGK